MFDLEKLVRPCVKKLTPYSCARDDFKGKADIYLDANENPFGHLNRYPDPYQRELKSVISKIKDVPENKIFLGNGSDEIIDLCFRLFCIPGTDKALTFHPSYGMFDVSASVNDVEIVRIPLTDRFNISFDDIIPWLSDDKLKLILICSPNNPTGNCMDRAVIERIISSFDGIILMDEAYIDFADQPSLKDCIGKYPNLIVMQTFSKAFGLASVRVGMAFTNPEIVLYFNKIKPPYNISTLNQKAVLNKLNKAGEYKAQVIKIMDERKRLSQELAKLQPVLEIYPSDANFILVRVTDAGLIYDYLVKKGIIIRNRSSVMNNCLRITVGKKYENTKLLQALKMLGK